MNVPLMLYRSSKGIRQLLNTFLCSSTFCAISRYTSLDDLEDFLEYLSFAFGVMLVFSEVLASCCFKKGSSTPTLQNEKIEEI